MTTVIESGRYGAVNGHHGVSSWETTESTTNPTRVDSSTRGGTARKKGISDTKGSFTTTDLSTIWFPGQVVSFTGFVGGASYGANALTKAASIIIDSLGITINPETGDPTQLAYGFSVKGSVTDGTGNVLDARDDLPHCPLADFAPTFGGTAIDHVKQLVLNFVAANIGFVDSSTAGKTDYRPGPIDWTGSISRTGVDDTFAVHDKGILVVGLGDLGNFTLDRAIIESDGPIQVAPDGSGITSQTLSIAKDGQNDDGSPGEITLLGTTFWPPEAA